jgi:uncharacterized protein DUF1236
MSDRSAIKVVTLVLCGGLVGAYAASAQTTPPAAPGSDTGVSGAIEQKLILSPAQRTAIYDRVSKDKSKVAPKDFSPVIGADVPPMIELYMLPDEAVAGVPAAKLYKYTMVENKVVLVDPTKMRIIDVIAPPPSH